MDAVIGSPVTKRNGRYTFADYLTWPDEERWEIINGEAWCMTPAPTTVHQALLVRLSALCANFFARHSCTVLVAPTDVVFDEYNVVQPDLLVVCDGTKVTEANIQGAPDLVVEILSPRTSRKDKREKKNLYQRGGVTEYLLIHPTDETLEQFRLIDGVYQGPEVFSWNETFRSHKFPELLLNLWEVFGKELPGNQKAQPRPGEGS